MPSIVESSSDHLQKAAVSASGLSTGILVAAVRL
jgi:hypothetical protein